MRSLSKRSPVGWPSKAFTIRAPSSCRASSRCAAASSTFSPPDWYEPVRVEFFGDEVESIRRFEVASQRSLASLDAVDVTILDRTAIDHEHFTAYVPQGAWFLLLEPAEIEQEGRHYLTRLDRPQDFHAVNEVMKHVYRFPSVTAASIAAASLETTCHLKIESVERFSGDIAKVRDELDEVGAGQEVYHRLPDRGRGPPAGRRVRRDAAGDRGASAFSASGTCSRGSAW